MADWNIRPRAAVCCFCEKPFAVGDKGHSLLSQVGDQWLRQDCCAHCFNVQKAQLSREQANAWSFVVPPSQKVKAAEVVKRETAEHLLRTLLLRQRPEDVGMIYILSILLERNKQFVERQTFVDDAGHRVRVYEQRATGDIFKILDPGLRPIDVPALQRRIVALIEGTESLDETQPNEVAPTEGRDGDASAPVACVEATACETTASSRVPLDMSMERMHEEALPFLDETMKDNDQ
jgi:hypothetical protein